MDPPERGIPVAKKTWIVLPFLPDYHGMGDTVVSVCPLSFRQPSAGPWARGDALVEMSAPPFPCRRDAICSFLGRPWGTIEPIIKYILINTKEQVFNTFSNKCKTPSVHGRN